MNKGVRQPRRLLTIDHGTKQRERCGVRLTGARALPYLSPEVAVMDFSLTDEQAEIRDAAARFAQEHLQDADDSLRRDREGEFSRSLWQECARFGMQGLSMPEEYGGTGRDQLSCVLAMEGLGYGCRDNGLLFSLNAQIWSVQIPILEFGSPEQKQKYLPGLIKGEIVAAHGITEPGSGSDAYSLTTRARRHGKGYRLNGSKTFVSNAPVADLFLVFATTDPAQGVLGITPFLVDRENPGLKLGPPISKMGLKTSPMSEVFLDDCQVDEDSRLGLAGGGAAVFNLAMGWERAHILASCVGTMRRQVEACVAYAQNRTQFGQPIGKFQSMSHKIAEMQLRLDSARLLLYRAAWMRDQGREAALEVALAKLHISECFLANSLDAVQIHGGYGYTAEYHFERDVRDAVGARIYSGTSEIQKNLIARELGL